MKDRIIKRWIDRGVSFVDTTSVFISSDVKMGKRYYSLSECSSRR